MNLLFKYRLSYNHPFSITRMCKCLQVRVEAYLKTVISASYFKKIYLFEVFFSDLEIPKASMLSAS